MEALAQTGFDRLHQHQRHSAAADLGRIFAGIPQPFSGHAFFQSAALPAPAGSDPGAGYRSRRLSNSSRISPTGAWARAWCRARTRRTSSPTASAAFSAARFKRSRSRTITRSKKWTRSPAPLIGLPNSASFRLLDIVGLDVWAFVGTNLYHAVPDDPWRDRFLMPNFQQKMIERGWLGERPARDFTSASARKKRSTRSI